MRVAQELHGNVEAYGAVLIDDAAPVLSHVVHAQVLHDRELWDRADALSETLFAQELHADGSFFWFADIAQTQVMQHLRVTAILRHADLLERTRGELHEQAMPQRLHDRPLFEHGQDLED